MTSSREAADRLIGAYRTGPVPPLRDILDAADACGAYAIQRESVKTWVAQGRRIIGRKIGLTSATVQAQLGVDQPDFGVLFDDMLIEDGGMLRRSCVIQPKAEAEVAFVLAKNLSDPHLPREVLADAIAEAVPAIEIVDSRIADWRITFADTVADNGSAAYFVLGAKGRAIESLDLWTCGMALEINQEVRSVGAGAACLGHHLNAALWLARLLAERGEELKSGDVILTGALGPMVPIKPGDRIRASIGGLGSASFTFTED